MSKPPVVTKTALTEVKEPKPLTTVKNNSFMTFVAPNEIEVLDEGEVDVKDRGAKKEDSGQLSLIRFLQSNSPQVGEGQNAIKGARQGDFINISTNDVYSGKLGLYFVPAYTHLKYVEYVEREKNGSSGGGFLATYESDNPYVIRFQKAYWKSHGQDEGSRIFDKIPSGTVEDEDHMAFRKNKQLVETWSIDGVFIVPNPDGSCPGELGERFLGSMPFSSTAIAAYNRWAKKLEQMKYNIRGTDSKVRSEELHLWSHVFHVRTAVHPKSAGSNVWMTPIVTLGNKDEDGHELNYKFSRMKRDEKLYKEAEDLNTSILEGVMGYAREKDTDQTGHDTQNGQDTDQEAPFPKL